MPYGFFLLFFVFFFLEHNVGSAGSSNFFVLELLPVYFPVKSLFVLQDPDSMQMCSLGAGVLGLAWVLLSNRQSTFLIPYARISFSY